MIQRIQSIFLLLSISISIIIVFYFPVLKSGEVDVYLSEQLSFSRLSVFISSGISVFSISQFKNRKRQLILNQFSKLFICIAIILVIIHRGIFDFTIGFFLLILPYILLFIANIFIKRDEKLVSSIDRIR